MLGGIARQVARRGQPFAPPCVLLSGGETTVTMRGEGRGGRNVEFLLSLALALDGTRRSTRLPATPTASTGGGGRRRHHRAGHARPGPRPGLAPRAILEDKDAHSFFEALGDQVISGPTLTNVNDFRAILIED